MSEDNLWGDFSSLDYVTSPRTILQGQISGLIRASNGILGAEVRSMKSYTSNFRYEFLIIVPSIGDYEYRLLTIEHPIALYPVKLDSDHLDKVEQCDDESEFKDALLRLFRSEPVRRIIARLISQA